MYKRAIAYVLLFALLFHLPPMAGAVLHHEAVLVPEETAQASLKDTAMSAMSMENTDTNMPADSELSDGDTRTEPDGFSLSEEVVPVPEDVPSREVRNAGLTFGINNGCAYLSSVSGSVSGELVIPATYEGYPVTEIGQYCCFGNNGITSVVLPDTVTKICFGAFRECPNLKSVTFPSRLREIWSGAFYGCSSLSELVFPDSLIKIQADAFQYCGVETIRLPKNLREISAETFYHCNRLKEVIVPEDNASFVAVDGILFDKNMTKVILYPRAKTDTTYTIPETVTEICVGAFRDCKSLTSVTLPENLEWIRSVAFAGCTGISEFDLPEGVKYIEGHAFNSCNLTAMDLPAGLEEISCYAFRECKNLAELRIPDSNEYYKTVDNVLYSKDGTELMFCPYKIDAMTYTVPAGVKVIADSAFCDNANLNTVILPDGLTTISEGAFYMAKSIANVNIPDTVTHIGDFAFSQSRIKELHIPDSVDTIAYWLCEKCYSLEEVSIGKGIRYMDYSAFAYCGNLKTVTIDPEAQAQVLWNCVFRGCGKLESISLPSKVRFLMEGAFSECYALKSVTLPNSLERIERMCFDRCTSLESVVLPEGLLNIGHYVFTDCTALKQVTIPDSLTGLHATAFDGCTALDVEACIPEDMYRDLGGSFYRGIRHTYEGTRCHDMANEVLNLVNKERAAVGAAPLTYDKNLSRQAMLRAAELVFLFSHDRPNGVSVLYSLMDAYGENVAAGYSSSASVMTGWMNSSGHRSNILNNQFASMGVGCFAYNGGYYWVQLFSTEAGSGTPATGTEPIGEEILIRTDAKDSVGFILAGEEECANEGIGLYASFYRLTLSPSFCEVNKGESGELTYALTTATEDYSECNPPKECIRWTSENPDSVTVKDGTVTAVAPGSSRITVSMGALQRDARVYVVDGDASSTNPKDFEINGTCGDGAFWTLNRLTGLLTISGRGLVQEAPWNTEENRKLITEVVIEDGIVTLCEEAFYYCNNLKKVSLPDSLCVIRKYAFSGCQSLTQIDFPEKLWYIGDYAFSSSGLTEVYLPVDARSVFHTAFRSCDDLTFITVDPNNQYMSNDDRGVLYDGDALHTMPYSIRGAYSLAEGTASVLPGAFGNHKELTELYFPASFKSDEFSGEEFFGCEKLEKITVSPDSIYLASDAQGALYDKEMTRLFYAPTAYQGKFIVPEGVESIGSYAFSWCSGLTDIVLPQSLLNIYSNAIEYCFKLRLLTIPEGVELVGKNAVNGTPLAAIVFESTDCAIVSLSYSTAIVLFGYEGSTAQTFAQQKGYAFRLIGSDCGEEHIWDRGEVITESTCVQEGTARYHCYFCDETKVDTLPVTNHTFIPTVVAPGCTHYGYTRYQCECGYYYDSDYTEAVGHAWDDGVVVVVPTETLSGLRNYTCTRCGETRYESIEAIHEACDGGPDCESYHFSDVNKNAWYHSSVDYAIRNGLFNGMSSDSFAPNASMTRAMLVTVLWRYAGEPEEGSNTFTDVPDGKWHTKAIAWAAHNGVVNGVGDGKFDPDGKITREQMATILYRYASNNGIDTSANDDMDSYVDSTTVSPFAHAGMRWAVSKGLIRGSGDLLMPKGDATRAQVAAILMRFIEYLVKT